MRTINNTLTVATPEPITAKVPLAAKCLGVSSKTLRLWIKQGWVVCVPISNAPRSQVLVNIQETRQRIFNRKHLSN